VARKVWKCGAQSVEVWRAKCGSVARKVWKCGARSVKCQPQSVEVLGANLKVWKCGAQRFDSLEEGYANGKTSNSPLQVDLVGHASRCGLMLDLVGDANRCNCPHFKTSS
jgi:hypothetical protein